MVNHLKSQQGFKTPTDTLDATTLIEAIGQVPVKPVIASLIGAEFPEVKGVNQGNISATAPPGGQTVEVTLGTGSDNQGDPVPVIGNVKIKVQGNASGLNPTNATAIAKRLAKAAVKAKVNSTYNPGQELVMGEYGAGSPTFAALGQNVNVTNAGGSSHQKIETVTISGGGDKFEAFVKALAPQIEQQASTSSLDYNKIAAALKTALDEIKKELETVKSQSEGINIALDGHGKFFGLDAELTGVTTNANNLKTAMATMLTEKLKELMKTKIVKGKLRVI